MTQNRSSAVMAQRIEPHDSLDDFPTPCWGTRALMEHVIRPLALAGRCPLLRSVWEPACNRGYMVRPLEEYFDRVHASDIFDYTAEPSDHVRVQDRVVDFLWPNSESPHLAKHPVEWVITNPPFKLAERFIARAREVATVGCAMLVRTSFLEGADRYRKIFSPNPPTIVAQFSQRLIITKRVVRDPSKNYWDEGAQKWRKPSTATAYAWLVWIHGQKPEPFQWIPPCFKQLNRSTDYAE